LHTAVDTCGFAQWSSFQQVLAHTDLFLYDLKLIDPIAHEKYTSVNNQLILTNLKRLFDHQANVELRIPFIPGINDSKEEAEGILSFLKKEVSNDVRIHLLPYHNIADGKYRKLKLTNHMQDIQAADGLALEELKLAIASAGFEVAVGG
jgi:pyruvate formate lyase activating enzyme